MASASNMLFDRKKVFLGITPTGWTNDDLPSLGDHIPFEQCVSEMALAGYQGCSVGHKFPEDRRELKRALELRGLRVTEPWAGTYFTVKGAEQRTIDDFEAQLAFIKEMGGRDIVCAELGQAVHQQPIPLFANKPTLDETLWRKLVDGINLLGRKAEASGMRLCYHPHMGTVVQTRAEIDRFMAETDPKCVHMLLDTGHLTFAGEDPLAITKAYARRIGHVHLKDVRPEMVKRARETGMSFLDAVVHGAFTVPGDGAIDFRPILGALAEAGYEGWLVVEAEQDPAKAHPLTYAKKARAYLHEVTGL